LNENVYFCNPFYGRGAFSRAAERQTLAVETLIKFYFMYAIVDIAGQQFKVEAGKELFVNRLSAAKDTSVEFDKVLLIDTEGKIQLGAPYVKGAVVKATVLDDDVKADKVLVFKKIRRKGFQKLNGHRQKLTKIRIDAIA
jgi:large subunit ribosomal protein L21